MSGVTGTSAKWMKPEEGLCYSLTCEASSLHDWSVPDHMNHMFFQYALQAGTGIGGIYSGQISDLMLMPEQEMIRVMEEAEKK